MPTYFLKTQFLLFALTSFLLLNNGCKKNTTEPVETLALTLEDVSCTEVWVKVTTTNYQTPNTLTLFVNDKADQNITLVSGDTVLYVDSLLPNQSYKIKAAFTTNNQQQTTNEVVATTMDTTIHNFTWQTFTFGDNSMLHDVAIINENNIWAVGEIYMKDSLGNQDPTPYNAVHWDGSKWEVKRITVLFRGNYITPQLYGIFALSEKEIWLSSGVPIKGDGNTWTQYHLFDMGILTQQDGYLTKIWGSSPDDIYYVGTLGTIAHYNGKIWKKIESGTILTLNDIWGGSNKLIGNDVVLVTASEKFIAREIKIFRIKNNTILDTLPWSMPERRIHSIWFNQYSPVFTAGGGVFQSKKAGTWMEMSLPLIYTNSLRGNASNDLIVVGDFGLVAHYNGVAWKVSDELKLLNGFYNSVAIKGNVVITAGWDGVRARIAFGRR